MNGSSSSTDLIAPSELEDTQKNSCPDLKPPGLNEAQSGVNNVVSGMRFEYDNLFDFDNEPTIEEGTAYGPDTVREINAGAYESIFANEPEELGEEDLEQLPPDTVENAPVFTKENESFFAFLYEHRLIGRKSKNHIGISLDDGSKFDVVADDQNVIKFECDIPITVNGEIYGVRCFDMQFSAVTGECYRFSRHEVCFFEPDSAEKKEFEKVASELPVPEWQGVLKKFSNAFKDRN